MLHILAQGFGDLGGFEKFFAACALIGGVFFVFRLVMQAMGLHGHGGIDTVHVDMGHVDAGHGGGPDAHHGDSDMSFKLLSLQGLTAFFLMFGLVGLAMTHQSRLAAGWALVGGMAAGLGTVWVLGKLFCLMKGLQCSGTLDLRRAVGKEGTVYLTLPAGEVGKVQVTVQDHLGVFDAVCGEKVEIKTGEKVRVVDVMGANTLVVEKF